MRCGILFSDFLFNTSDQYKAIGSVDRELKCLTLGGYDTTKEKRSMWTETSYPQTYLPWRTESKVWMMEKHCGHALC